MSNAQFALTILPNQFFPVAFVPPEQQLPQGFATRLAPPIRKLPLPSGLIESLTTRGFGAPAKYDTFISAAGFRKFSASNGIIPFAGKSMCSVVTFCFPFLISCHVAEGSRL
jgi:hypothetical protein